MKIEASEHPATTTDLIVQPISTQVLEYDDCLIVRCPQRPDFWFGNYMVIGQAPAADEVTAWWQRWQQAFSDLFGVQRMVLQWEEPVPITGISPATQQQYSHLGSHGVLECSVVLALDAHRAAECETITGLGEPRPVSGDREWTAVTELLVTELATTEGEADLLRWRMNEYRRLTHSGRGRWWASWNQGSLVGTAGLIWRCELCRFQEVVTLSSVRGAGVCSHLCQTMIRQRLGTVVDQRMIVVAGLGSPAERIYRRLGFRPLTLQWSLIAEPPEPVPGY